MKKLFLNFSLLAVLSLSFFSCQKEKLGNVDNGNSFKITAEIVDNSTKVTYDVDNSENTISPKWTAKDDSKSVIGDKIFGFDSKGNTFSFTVTAVTDGKATLTSDEPSYIPENGTKLYAIYYPTKGTGDFVGEGTNRTLNVNLSAQTGAALGDNSPVLMCATGTVEENTTNLIFDNVTAIVGVKKFKIGANETVSSVKVSGLVTSGTFKVSDGKMILEASSKTNDITIDDFSSTLTSDEDGIVGTDDVPALMFATLPKTGASISISATTDKGEYVTLTNLTGDIAAGGYYFGTKKLYCVAEVTIGGTSTKYATLEAAVAAANAATSAATIKMLKDVEGLSSKLSISNSENKKVILDLNGKKVVSGASPSITFNTEGEIKDSENIGSIESTVGRPISIVNTNFTLTSGTIIGSGETYGSMYIGGSTVTFNGGKIKVTDNLSSVGRGLVISSGSSVTIKKLDISAVGYAIYASGSSENTTVSIEPDNDDDVILYSSGNYALYSNTGAEVEIAGGCYYAGATGKASISAASGVTIDCSGGYYNSKDNLSPESGYIVQTLSTPKTDLYGRSYNYRIAQSTLKAAKVKTGESGSEEEYDTLAEAAAAANGGEDDMTITILSQCSSSEDIVLQNANSKKITLDINGKVVNASFSILGNVEVVDGVESSTGYIESQGSTLNVSGNGCLTLRSGKIKATGTAASTANTGIYVHCSSNTTDNLIINGGSVIANSQYGALCVFKGKATINSGYFTGPRSLFTSTNANVQVNDGTFTATGSISNIHIGSATLSIKIDGGKFYSTTADSFLSYYKSEKFYSYSNNLKVSAGKFFTHVDIDNLVSGKINSPIYDEEGLSFEVINGTYGDGEVFFGGSVTSFATAVTSANASTKKAEIKLLKDISITSSVELNNTNSKTIVLDLRGKKIAENNSNIKFKGTTILADSQTDGEISTTEGTSPAVIVDGGNFTMSGGKLSSSAAQYGTLRMTNSPTVTVCGNSIIYNESESDRPRAIYVGSGSLSIEDNTPDIYSAKSYPIYINSATVYIKGGYIRGGTYCVYLAGSSELVVTGGNFKSNILGATGSDAKGISYKGKDASRSFSGGYYSVEPSGIKSGFECVDNPKKTTAEQALYNDGYIKWIKAK